jgi:tetratricopeptide (TPR) repeat protein
MTAETNFLDHVQQLLAARKYNEVEHIALTKLANERENSWVLKVLSSLYRSTKRFEAAEAICKRALANDALDAATHTNYGNLLVDMDRMDDALHHTAMAVKLEPSSERYLYNHAVALRQASKFEEAEKAYLELIRRAPDNMEYHLALGFINLYMRKLDKGWEGYATRIHNKDLAYLKKIKAPEWKGEPDTKNKTLLVLGEQGFGDTIMIARFIPALAKKFKKVGFVCKQPLHRLFADLPAEIILEDKANFPQTYDYHLPLMSIPPLIEKDWLKWPEAPPLNIPPASKKKFSGDYHKHGERLRVGIVWSGSTTFTYNDKRAVSLRRFHELASRVPEVQFFSFQKGPPEKELINFGMGTIVPAGPEFEDFADTAAAAKHMDLVMMTDSSVAHLCGSIGVPLLNLVHTLPYWLYYPAGPKVPMYPSWRMLWQKKEGDWDPVFDKATLILEALVKARAKGKLSHEDVLKVIDKTMKKAA